jgi:hypothetical protein
MQQGHTAISAMKNQSATFVEQPASSTWLARILQGFKAASGHLAVTVRDLSATPMS